MDEDLHSKPCDDEETAFAWQQEIEARLKRIADGSFVAQYWRNAVAEIRRDLRKDAKP